MPRYDGTGPRGAGPMTGRGEGYCVLELSDSGTPARGYAGLANNPVRATVPAVTPARSPSVITRRQPGFRRTRAWFARRRRRSRSW